MTQNQTPAPELSAQERAEVERFGLDRPEERPTVRLMAAIEMLELWPDTVLRDALLATLRHTLSRMQVRVAHGGREAAVWSSEHDGIRLADAIIEVTA